MIEFEFTVPGIPHGQGRPRFRRMPKFVMTYDPAESRDWKAKVALFANQARCRPIEGPVAMFIACYMPRPKYLLKKKSFPGRIPCDKKPDLSNIQKGIEDALEGICYANDSQIFKSGVSKWYVAIGESPATVITLRSFEPEHATGALL